MDAAACQRFREMVSSHKPQTWGGKKEAEAFKAALKGPVPYYLHYLLTCHFLSSLWLSFLRGSLAYWSRVLLVIPFQGLSEP